MADTQLENTAEPELESEEEQISIKVTPPGPDNQDIQVEIKRKESARVRAGQRKLAALFLAGMFLMLFPMIRDGLALYRMSRELQVLQERNEELNGAKNLLEVERESLYSLETIERLAREDLGMVLPGESKGYQAIPTVDIPQQQTARPGASTAPVSTDGP